MCVYSKSVYLSFVSNYNSLLSSSSSGWTTHTHLIVHMYVKYRLIRNKHVLHAIRFTSIPCVKKIHAITSKNNQNLILRNRQVHPLYRQPTREFSLVFRGIRGLLKLRYVLLGSAVGGGYQVKKVGCTLVFNDI